MKAQLAFLALVLANTLSAQTRLASDFELATLEKQIARERDPIALTAAHLNLGDLRASRTESSLSRAEYSTALRSAEKERRASRTRSDLAGYALATAYSGLSSAKLGRGADAFDAFEESIRYASNSPRIWNLYASAMSLLRLDRKAVATARNAVAIATRDFERYPTTSNRLDLEVYRYALASSLTRLGERSEAADLLASIIESLASSKLDAVRREITRAESFEIYSSARGEVSAYLSLLSRSRLRLAALHEEAGRGDDARRLYEEALTLRSDDPTALAGLARLATGAPDRRRYFREAFAANPFAFSLIEEYERYLQGGGQPAEKGSMPASAVQGAVEALARGESRTAAELLVPLIEKFPENDALRFLQTRSDIALGDFDAALRDIERVHDTKAKRQLKAALAEATGRDERPLALVQPKAPVGDASQEDLRALMVRLSRDTLTPEERERLDSLEISSLVRFDPATPGAPQTTTFRSGRIGGVRFRFSNPTTFAGTYAGDQPLRLTFRVLGATQSDGADALLLEPLRVSVP